jgi:hypothetical protein
MVKPKANQNNVSVEQVGDELVILDQETMRAHSLNSTAAAVWRHCDGTKTIPDLAQILRSEQIQVADEDLVWLSLDRLSAVGLLEQPIARTASQIRTSRREFVRKVGKVGAVAIALPIIISMIRPTPAQAQTGGVTGPTGPQG